MGKRRVGRYPLAFRQMAVDRLRKCDNVVRIWPTSALGLAQGRSAFSGEVNQRF